MAFLRLFVVKDRILYQENTFLVNRISKKIIKIFYLLIIKRNIFPLLPLYEHSRVSAPIVSTLELPIMR